MSENWFYGLRGATVWIQMAGGCPRRRGPCAHTAVRPGVGDRVHTELWDQGWGAVCTHSGGTGGGAEPPVKTLSFRKPGQ